MCEGSNNNDDDDSVSSPTYYFVMLLYVCVVPTFITGVPYTYVKVRASRGVID